MRFADIIGQEKIKHELTEMFYNNRVSHALLFLGKEGAGALPMAIAFSQFLVCEKVQSQQNPSGISLFEESEIPDKIILKDACGVCPACIKANQLAHPDIHFSYPVVSVSKKKKDFSDENEDDEKKKGNRAIDFIEEWREFISQLPYGTVTDWIEAIKATPNQQGKITANECYDIVRKLSLKSFESGYKILILWMPEMLAKEANILLKTLEEPPPDTLIMLVAENENLVLPTILSRCQLVKIPAIETNEIEQSLLSKKSCSAEQAKQIANASEGNFREALNLLQHAGEDFYGLLREWLNATLKNQTIAQVKLIEEIARMGREKQKQFLKHFIHLLEQAVRMEIVDGVLKENVLNAMSESEKDFVARLNKATSLEQKEAIAGELNKASYYIERNANAKILFHALSIKIFHIVKNNMMVA